MRHGLAVCALYGALAGLLPCCAPKHGASAKPKDEARVASTPSAATSVARVPSGPASSTNVAAAPSCSAPGKLSDAGVTDLVAHWRAAQKAADFPAYSALYGEHFVGLVIHGTSTARVDRAAWLAAHQGSLMLQPSLARASARVVIAAGGAQVTFGARSVRAADTPPELFVVATAAGPRIVREAPAREAPTALSDRPGLWLADEHYAVLSTTPELGWADGEPSTSAANTATSSVALDRLPKALRAWLGRPVRVLGESGAVCETRLQRFVIRAKISPDLPTAEVWDGCGEDRPSAAAIANDIWKLSAREGRTLVAEFSAPCKGALLAVDPDLEAPPIAAPEPASPDLGAAALTAFRALPDYSSIQARFKAESPEAEGAWEDRQGRRSVWSLSLPNRAPLVFVSVEAGSGCASFSASLSALWQVSQVSEIREGGAAPSLTLLAVPSAADDRRLTPQAAVDLGGAGGVSLLLGPDGVYGARSLLSKTRAGYRQILLTSVPFFAGPC